MQIEAPPPDRVREPPGGERRGLILRHTSHRKGHHQAVVPAQHDTEA